MRVARFLLLLCVGGASLEAQFHAYVGRLSSSGVLLAWGTTRGGGNTIGRSSRALGPVTVTIDDRPVTVPPGQNWVETPLPPDTEHRYKVVLDAGRRLIGEGVVRTWPDGDPDRLCFFVIGDYGDGGPGQAAVAKVMATVVREQEKANNPVRFVLTTGDNIYGKERLFFPRQDTGDQDAHWESRFFAPYAEIVRSVPFYPSLGNHDGDESERAGDLDVYLDNFFLPGEIQAGGRYYRFSYGKLAEFFCLDSTTNRHARFPAPGVGSGSEQLRWVDEALRTSPARWKIPYYHHPRYCGGPGHTSEPALLDLVGVLERRQVGVVFNGHEHNWQPIEQTTAAGRRLYHVITGAGGELRSDRPSAISLDGGKARLVDWAPRHHFLLVAIEGDRMTMTPIGTDARPIAKPLEVRLR